MRTITLLNGNRLELRKVFNWDFQGNKIDIELNYEDFIGYDLRSNLLSSLIKYIGCNAQYSMDIYNQICTGFIPLSVLDGKLNILFKNRVVNILNMFNKNEIISALEAADIKVLEEDVDYTYATAYDEDGYRYMELIFTPKLRELVDYVIGEVVQDKYNNYLVTNLYVEGEDGMYIPGMFSSARLPKDERKWNSWANAMLSYQKSLVEG